MKLCQAPPQYDYLIFWYKRSLTMTFLHMYSVLWSRLSQKGDASSRWALLYVITYRYVCNIHIHVRTKGFCCNTSTSEKISIKWNWTPIHPFKLTRLYFYMGPFFDVFFFSRIGIIYFYFIKIFFKLTIYCINRTFAFEKLFYVVR